MYFVSLKMSKMSPQLLELLRSFSSKEIKRLGEFARSPYHNKQSFVTMLFDEMAKYYPSFDSSSFTKENIFSILYPGQVYNDTRMRNLTSDLFALVENFIAVERFSQDRFSQSVLFLETLPDKQLDNMFERKYHKTLEWINEDSQLNEINYLNRLRLFEVRSIYVNRRKFNDAAENLECYQDIVNESIKFFLASLFKNYAIMLNKNITFFKYDYDTRFIDIIMEYMEHNLDDNKNETCIMLYYYFTVFYMNYDEESYSKLETFTKDNFEKLDRHDALNAIVNMTTYCRRQALAGSSEYERTALNLFNRALDKGLWNETSRLRPTIFRAIVSVACNCKEFEWCEKFIKEYRGIQPKEHEESNVNLCFARLYFDRKEFSNALQHLAKIVTIDPTYKYEADTLTIRIFYETNEAESYISKVESFKRWVSNNKTVLSERYRSIFKEMADYFETLVKLRLEPDEFKLKKMKLQIEANKTLVNRLWFLDKLRELER